MIPPLKMFPTLWVGLIMVWEQTSAQLVLSEGVDSMVEPVSYVDFTSLLFPEDMFFPSLTKNSPNVKTTDLPHEKNEEDTSFPSLTTDISPKVSFVDSPNIKTPDLPHKDNPDDNSRNKDDISETRPPNYLDNLWGDFGDLPSLDSFWVPGSEDKENLDRVKRRAKIDHQSARIRDRPHHYEHPNAAIDRILEPSSTTKKPAVNPENMNPGVVFRVRMSDAILRIKQRMYEDPERHVEADIIYTNLIKNVVADEIVRFNDLLLMYKTDKNVKEHIGECGGRIYKFITYVTVKVHVHCLFDSLWIDGTPYVIGDEYSVTPLEIPPQLQCDAAECSTIAFVDSFDEPLDFEE